MFTKLMNMIENTKTPLDINEICRALDADKSVVEGMLMTMRRMGYLDQDQIQKADYQIKANCPSCHGGKCIGCG